MLNEARIKAKTAQCVAEIVKEIKIFDAILHAKVALDAIDSSTIVKCFKRSGIHKDLHQSTPSTPPTTPTNDIIDEDPDFATYFQELLGIPWDQYLAMDEELE